MKCMLCNKEIMQYKEVVTRGDRQVFHDKCFVESFIKKNKVEIKEEKQQKEINMDKEIILDRGFFRHILNCLANQKYLHEQPEEERKKSQDIIDEAWQKGMDMLNPRPL